VFTGLGLSFTQLIKNLKLSLDTRTTLAKFSSNQKSQLIPSTRVSLSRLLISWMACSTQLTAISLTLNGRGKTMSNNWSGSTLMDSTVLLGSNNKDSTLNSSSRSGSLKKLVRTSARTIGGELLKSCITKMGHLKQLVDRMERCNLSRVKNLKIIWLSQNQKSSLVSSLSLRQVARCQLLLIHTWSITETQETNIKSIATTWQLDLAQTISALLFSKIIAGMNAWMLN